MLAQNLRAPAVPFRPRIITVPVAHKPIFLHTGMPITALQKQQLLASVVKAAKAAPTRDSAIRKQSQAAPSSPAVTMITPQQLFRPGVADATLSGAEYVDLQSGFVTLGQGLQSYLTIVVNVQPNTAYMLAFKVDTFPGTPAQYTVFDGIGGGPAPGPAQNPESFTLNYPDNEFVYGFDSNTSGEVAITVYSPNAASWGFLSAELTSTSF